MEENRKQKEEKNGGFTLSDIYNAARTETRFNYAFWLEVALGILFKRGFRLFSNFLVVVVIVLIAILASVGMFVVLPLVATLGTAWHTFNVFWGTFLIYSIIFNYFHVSTCMYDCMTYASTHLILYIC